MTTHCSFPAVDSAPNRPATLSPAVLTGLLREKLGFDGVLLTDCLEMRGVAEVYGPEQAAVLAVQAGADLALLTHSFDKQLTAHRLLVEAVRSGLLPYARLGSGCPTGCPSETAAFLRKGCPPVDRKKAWERVPIRVDQAENQSLAQQIAAAALTLVKNEEGLLPLKLAPEEEIYLLSFHHQG